MGLGELIVIEGGNGSGKETETTSLIERLTQEGRSVETMAFPRYGHPSCKDVEEYLQGKKGPSSSISPYVASVFYANDRKAHAPQIREWLEDGKVVVLDRYIGSNKGHQAGKIGDRQKIDEYLLWLDDLEFNQNNIPKPDITILLNLPWKIAMEATIARAAKKGTILDEHEKDPVHVQHASEAYMYVAQKEGWKILECYPDGENGRRLSMPEMHELVYAAAKKVLRN